MSQSAFTAVSEIVRTSNELGAPPIENYIGFLGWPSSGLAVAPSFSALVGILYGLKEARHRRAVWYEIGCFLALLLLWFCIQASIPTWWPDFCVAFGCLLGLVLFVAVTTMFSKRLRPEAFYSVVLFGLKVAKLQPGAK